MRSTPLHRVVIVGNGIAGLTAADTLRAGGFDGELIIVGDERHPAYSRPALSKALLADSAADDAHHLPPPDHQATELLGRAATGLDIDRRVLHLEDSTEVSYEGWSSQRDRGQGPWATSPSSPSGTSTTPYSSGLPLPAVQTWSCSAADRSAWKLPLPASLQAVP